MTQLAIIIPAYKRDYLDETLRSLANQTNKDFRVYVGDDSSPYVLKDIVATYSSSIDIVYKRFETNLGATSLTRQWERCVELSKDEPYIWLFSDDDIAAPDCVESFYKSRETSGEGGLYKFEVVVVDGSGMVIPDKNPSINRIDRSFTSKDFLELRLACKGFRCFAVEFIFSRALYNKLKFVEFPLAWASDDATWASYLYQNNGLTLLESKVFWRYSGGNISSNAKEKKVVELKIEASVGFIKWLKRFSQERSIKIDELLMLHWLSIQLASLKMNLSLSSFHALIKESDLKVKRTAVWRAYLLIVYYHAKNAIRSVLQDLTAKK